MEKCYLIQWPDSKKCKECGYGASITNDEFDERIKFGARLCFYNSDERVTICYKEVHEITKSEREE